MLDFEKPTEINVIRRCIFKYRLPFITVDHIKATLINDFKVNSIKYGHVAKSYIRSFLLAAEDKGYGRFDSILLKFNLNMENM